MSGTERPLEAACGSSKARHGPARLTPLAIRIKQRFRLSRRPAWPAAIVRARGPSAPVWGLVEESPRSDMNGPPVGSRCGDRCLRPGQRAAGQNLFASVSGHFPCGYACIDSLDERNR